MKALFDSWRKLFFMLIILAASGVLHAGHPLTYYLPDIEFDQAVPSPEAFLGYQVGDWHVGSALTVSYMQLLAEKSERAILYEYARSHEQRPLVHLVITSESNHRKLEEIRLQHLQLADPDISASLDLSSMPLVVFLGYGVHGNEPSAHNAALLVAWYLVAGMSSEVKDVLENTVIVIDPSLNPDGQDRFASWVNRHRGTTLNPDPNSREFADVWPGSRTNHYWFDLNRDWLPVVHPESRGRIEAYHRWLPNINTDHHEFGANSTFYFQPGIPSRSNPLTPKETDALTMEIASYHAAAFDALGQYYYTEEDFDDFYFGKGSSYPDIHGAVGILFEQAGTKGHLRETDHGLKHFAETIRNQVAVSMSTLKASRYMREKLLEHMRWFYRSAADDASRHPVQAYVFGDPADQARNMHMVDMLLTHQVDVYELAKPLQAGGHGFQPGTSWIVPLSQPQHRLIRSMFEVVNEFNDSLFYDVSTWSIPLAFNMPYAEVGRQAQLSGIMGAKVHTAGFPEGGVDGGISHYAYVFSWDDYYAPKALYALQKHGIRTRVATAPYTLETGERRVSFGYGSIMIPVASQEMDGEDVFRMVHDAAVEAGIKVYPVQSGMSTRGLHLGSSGFAALSKPEILLVTGQGVNSREAGETWHLLDFRFGMPVTMADVENLANIDLGRYNVIILPSGNYNRINEQGKQALDRWLRSGGTMVAIGSAANWVHSAEFAKIEFVTLPEADYPLMLPYESRSEYLGARRIPGHINQASLDITHPLGYGYTREQLPVYISGAVIAKPLKSPFANPLIYQEHGHISGYIHSDFKELFHHAAGVLVHSRGQGRIVHIVDNPCFRGYWFGTNKLLLNTIFFGSIIRG